MSDFLDINDATAAVQDPKTSGTDLANIAQFHPSLRASIAGHPNAYMSLLQWLGQLGDPDVTRVVATRLTANLAAGGQKTAPVATQDPPLPGTLPVGAHDPIADLLAPSRKEPENLPVVPVQLAAPVRPVPPRPPTRPKAFIAAVSAVAVSLLGAFVIGGLVFSRNYYYEETWEDPMPAPPWFEPGEPPAPGWFLDFDRYGNDRFVDVALVDQRLAILGARDSENFHLLYELNEDYLSGYYSTEEKYNVIIGDGNDMFVAAGTVFNGQTWEAVISGLGVWGDQQWRQTYGADVRFNSLAPAVGGGTIALGSKSGNVVLTKISSDGVPQWYKDPSIPYTNPVLTQVAVAPDGSIYAAGSASTDTSSTQSIIVKFSATGDFMWAHDFGDAGVSLFHSVATAPNGDIVAVGEFAGTEGDSTDALIMRINPEGNVLWSKALGGAGSESFRDVAVYRNGQIAVVGQTWSNDGIFGSPYVKPDIPAQYAPSDAVVAMLAPDGEIMWTKVLGGSREDELSKLIIAPNGDIFAVGYTASTDGNLWPAESLDDGIILRFDMDGNIISI